VSPDSPDGDTLPDLFAQKIYLRDPDTREPISTLYAGELFNYTVDFGNFSPDDVVQDPSAASASIVFKNALILSEDSVISADDRVLYIDSYYSFKPG